jgi:hypothetical protein
MLTLLALIAAASAAIIVSARMYGAARWHAKSDTLFESLNAAILPRASTQYDAREIDRLPKPVCRYLRSVLQDGQRVIDVVRLSQEGEFRRSDRDGWRAFTATQVVTTRPPGFVWDARIRTAPALSAFVHDAYVAGDGSLHAEALGLATVADSRGTPAMAEGELLRYLAEAAWYPTALLPSQGVRWEAVDDSSANATLTDGATTVSLEFRFDSEGLIRSVSAASRYRGEIDGVPQFGRWEGSFSSYAVRHGMRIPLEAEVAWLSPEGAFPYCRLRLLEIGYDLALIPKAMARGCYAGLLLSTFR